MDFEQQGILTPQFVVAVAVGGAIDSVARDVAIGSGNLFGTNSPRASAVTAGTAYRRAGRSLARKQR
jgi:hypothetical protein